MEHGLVSTTSTESGSDSSTETDTPDGPVLIFRSERGHEVQVTAFDLLLILSVLSVLGIGTAVGSAAIQAANGGI